MKLLRRFGKFLNRHENETTGILVALFLIILLFEFFTLLKGTAFLTLLPSIAGLISATILFLAFQQSVKANKRDIEKLNYQFYLEVIEDRKKEGSKANTITLIEQIPELTLQLKNDFKFLESASFLIKVFNSKIFKSSKYSIVLNGLILYISNYLNFFEILGADIQKIKRENLSEENEVDLIRQFSELFDDFNLLGEKIMDIETENPEMSKSGFQSYEYSFIMRIQQIFQDIHIY